MNETPNFYIVEIVYDEEFVTRKELDNCTQNLAAYFMRNPSRSATKPRIAFIQSSLREIDPAIPKDSARLIRLIMLSERSSAPHSRRQAQSPAKLKPIFGVSHQFPDLVNVERIEKVAEQLKIHCISNVSFADQKSSNLLINAIEQQIESYEGDLFETSAPGPISPKILQDIADQVDFATDAIIELRLNTTYDIVQKLRSASSSLRLKAKTETEPQDGLQEIFAQIIRLSSQLLDVMENKKFAGLAVCGIIGSVIGLIGMPAVTATALLMAYAQGPAAFAQFISSIGDRLPIASSEKPKRRAVTKKKDAR